MQALQNKNILEASACPHMVPPYQDGPQTHLHGTNPKGDSSSSTLPNSPATCNPNENPA